MKVRRPRLTRKRIEGLVVIAERIEELMFDMLTPSERAKVKTAAQWARQMKERLHAERTRQIH